MKAEQKFANPYLMGVALGIVLLSSFLIMGKGLGASGAANRLGVAGVNTVAPSHVDKNSYMAAVKADGKNPLDDWYVFEILGVFLGGIVSSYGAGRLRKGVIKGPRITVGSRLVMALSGGILMGVAARIARGCTSGQALTGGALMSVGGWIFMLSVFAGGYAVAYFVRREWI